MLVLSIVLAWLVFVTIHRWQRISECNNLRRKLEIYEQEENEYDVDAPIVIY